MNPMASHPSAPANAAPHMSGDNLRSFHHG
jgi:hypothetical protein